MGEDGQEVVLGLVGGLGLALGLLERLVDAGEVGGALGDAGLEVVEVRRLFLVPGHGRARLLPTRPLVALEAALGRVPGLNRLSKNQIYVCRAAGEPPA